MNKIRSHITGIIRPLALITVLAVLAAFAGNASAKLTAKANHDHIKIDFFYHGSTVSVRGEADPGTDLIIKMTSPESTQVLRKKGKAAGLLWMNVGDIEFEHAPNLYFLHSTKKLEEVLAPEELDRYIIGYPALQKHVEISPAGSEEERSKWFSEFVRFKESGKVYNTSYGKITTTEKDGTQNYYIMMDWPYQAAPGNYTVTVHAVKDGKVVETAESTVLVEQVGFVKTMFDMAKNNGALYGAISILVALGAGFGVGMIFRKGGGAH